MKDNDILLSICIPTYNRANALRGNLDVLFSQTKGKGLPLEFIVSDNCSTDSTADVVNDYLEKGMPINYIKNAENIGMDGNFAQCYRRASGKYVLVLGDDDFLIDGMLEKLLQKLSTGDYGLVHLKTNAKSNLSDEVFDDSELFLKNISFWITYITSNVVNSKYIRDFDFEKYFGTYLAIMPLYIEASTSDDKNMLIYERVFADGVSTKTNGGYNFFEVFMKNYLFIWKSFQESNKISKSLFDWLKRDILKFFLIPNAYNFFILNEENNYKLEKTYFNFKKHYFSHLYFYFDSFKYVIKYNLKKVLSCFNILKK